MRRLSSKSTVYEKISTTATDREKQEPPLLNIGIVHQEDAYHIVSLAVALHTIEPYFRNVSSALGGGGRVTCMVGSK